MKKSIFLLSLFTFIYMLLFFTDIYKQFGFYFISFDLFKFLLLEKRSALFSLYNLVISSSFVFITYLLFFKKTLEISVYYRNILFFSIAVFVISILNFMLKYDVFYYINNKNKDSNFYEQYYVNPKNADIEAPKDKQNLIILYLESMEISYADEQFFGTNLIPELTELSLKNLSFTNFINGYCQNNTQMSIVASMTGIPSSYIFLNIGSKRDNNKNGQIISSYLPKAYSMAEILKDNGYQTLFMMGTEIKFAGADIFLDEHGFHNTAFGSNEIYKEYGYSLVKNWWAIKDFDLYNVFKDKIKNLSKSKPFFAVMCTTDTHFGDREIPYIPNAFNDNKKNIIRFSSRQAHDFIQWVKKQPFAKNTTIVIVGDHLRMDDNFFAGYAKDRYIYNVFINATSDVKNKKRKFNQVDLFPTILESVGFKIKNSKLGLGTSLFSKKQTLIENFGKEELATLLSENNKLYRSLWQN